MRSTNLAALLAKRLKVKDAVLDGEIVALDANGKAFLWLDEARLPSRLLRLRYSLAERA